MKQYLMLLLGDAGHAPLIGIGAARTGADFRPVQRPAGRERRNDGTDAEKVCGTDV